MKQETGKTNQPHEKQNRVSIQLTLGGHSFSKDELLSFLDGRAVEGTGPVEACVLTDKTLLIPREEFCSDAAATCLRIAGLGCTADEVAVWSDLRESVVAVMAANAAVVDLLREQLGDRLRFVSPLLSEPDYRTRSVWFYRHGDILYIKVYDDGLQFAEAVRFDPRKTEDFRFLLERLAVAFPLSPYKAFLSGVESETLRRTAKRYFKHIVCV